MIVKNLQNKIINGDSLKELKKIPDETFDLIFADPPYNLQLQNSLIRPDRSRVNAVDDKWDKFNSFKHYDYFCKAWLSQCKRVLKENGSIWVMGSYHNIFRLGYHLQNLNYSSQQFFRGIEVHFSSYNQKNQECKLLQNSLQRSDPNQLNKEN